MAPDRRLAILLAFAHAFEVMAMDDALDLLDLVITEIVHAAESEGQKERLRTLRDLDTAALQLWEAIQLLLDEQIADAAVRSQTFAQIPRQRLVDAGTQVETLARPPTITITRNSSTAIAVYGSFYPPSYALWRLTARRPANPCSRRWPFSGSSNSNTTLTCITPH